MQLVWELLSQGNISISCMDVTTSPGSYDSWGPQGCVKPSSCNTCLCHHSGAFILDQRLRRSHRSSFFKNVIDFGSTAVHSKAASNLIPYSIVSGSHFSTSCREGKRESGKISSCYFSILCCLNNIHSKPGGKCLIYCHSFSTVLVHF